VFAEPRPPVSFTVSASRRQVLVLLNEIYAMKFMPQRPTKQALGRTFGGKALFYDFSTKRLLGSVAFSFPTCDEPSP
jgi:hypothetical protein